MLFYESNMINIIPINDDKEHIEDTTCDCSPTISIESEEMIVIHNAYDNREGLEMAKDALNENFIEKHGDKCLSKDYCKNIADIGLLREIIESIIYQQATRDFSGEDWAKDMLEKCNRVFKQYP